MDKAQYFPRKKLFEEVQELVATFYSSGDYMTDQASDYATMLDADGGKDEFYYALLLLSLLPSVRQLVRLTDKIVRNMRHIRVKRKVTSVDEFAGVIDMEEYIRRNNVEKASPKEYPSIISVSTFQLPEYQLTLWILRHCENMYGQIFSALGDNQGVTVFDQAHLYRDHIRANAGIMQKKYGVSYSRRESYHSLRKKVVYRYKNRKILSSEYKGLIRLFERIMSLKGIDVDAKNSLDIFDHTDRFDDRLFEIWLIRRSSELIAKKAAAGIENIEYTPLARAQKHNTYSALIPCAGFRIEVLFQKRKGFMRKEELKWYWDDEGKMKEIGAIPDLVFLKYENGIDTPQEIVLVDAKNRTWTFPGDMQRVKGEIVQQIYICDNFASIFPDRYKSILVAHNVEGYQTRKYYHKDKPGYEIDVISLDFNEPQINSSLDKFGAELCRCLGV